MTTRRHAHTYAQPSTTAHHPDEPRGNCDGRPEVFDALIERRNGARKLAARREVFAMCAGCPLGPKCYRDNWNEPWMLALRNIDTRKPPTIRTKCGTRAGNEAHRKAGERPCEPCKEAERHRFHGRKRPMRHGTDSGYSVHYRRGETPCEKCKEAHRVAERERRERQKGLAA